MIEFGGSDDESEPEILKEETMDESDSDGEGQQAARRASHAIRKRVELYSHRRTCANIRGRARVVALPDHVR